MSRALAIAILLVAGVAAMRPARAAESLDTCEATIGALPVVLDTPGRYCLAQNLTTSNNTQAAIEIRADDVILDCNGWRIDASGLGTGVAVTGIQAASRANVTIRNCHVRGFRTGIELSQGGGPTSRRHLVEDNRVELSRATGITLRGDASVIRRNLVQNTLASVSGTEARAISTDGKVDVVDNLVAGVQSGNAPTYGIHTQRNAGGSVRNNRIHGLKKTVGTGVIEAIHNDTGVRIVIRDNVLAGDGLAGSVAVWCDVASDRTKGNVIKGFPAGIVGCSNDGNVIRP